MKRLFSALLLLCLLTTVFLSAGISSGFAEDARWPGRDRPDRTDGPGRPNGPWRPGGWPTTPNGGRPVRPIYPYGQPNWYNSPWGGGSYPYPPTIITPEPTVQPKQNGRASYGGITYSTEYLYQVWLNGRSIDFRLFGDGSKTVFKLSFDMTESGGTRMMLTASKMHAELKPVVTNAAISMLVDCGVTEVTIMSKGGQATTYSIDQLRSLTTG